MYLYADDARKYRAVGNDDDAPQLQKNLDALWNWTQGSLLKFNLSKCHQLRLRGDPNDQREVTQDAAINLWLE